MSERGDDHPRFRWSAILRATVGAGSAALIAVLLSGLWRLALVSPAGRAALAAYVVAGVAAPRAALLILAAAIPIVSMMTVLVGVALAPAAATEALVLCLLFGRAVRSVVRPTGAFERAELAALAFAAIAVASAAALVPVIDARTAGTVSFTRGAATVIVRDYFLRTADVRPIHDAALIAESAALFIVARRAAADAAFRLSLLRMLVAGATAAAVFNIVRLLTVSARAEAFGPALLNGLRSLRINVHHGDLNAAGSFFALFLCVAVGFAKGQQGWWAWPAAAALGTALWLAGSRSALAALAVAALGLFMWTAIRGRHAAVRRVAVGSTAVTLAVAAAVILLWPREGANMAMGGAVGYRVELWNAAARMIADHPFTGVGIGQFLPLSPRYRGPGEGGMRQSPENAHNNVLQIAAELGLPGIAVFLVWVGLGVAPAARRLSTGEIGRLDAALFTGIVAFALTWIGGHPLLLPASAFPFWLALGAIGPERAVPATRSTARYWIAAAVVLTLAGSIPFRTSAAFREVELDHVGKGLSSWLDGADGVKYRRAANCSGVYVPSSAAIVTVPLRAEDDAERPLTISFSVEDREVNAFNVEHAGWIPLRLRLPPPPASSRFRLLSLRVRGGGDDACEGVRVNVGKVTALDDRGVRIQ